MSAAHGAAMAVTALVARAQATWTLDCDGCGEATTEPDWCGHGRITCPGCREHTGCHHCRQEMRSR